MAETIRARELIRQAAILFDSPANRLAESGRDAWRRGFASGGCWMRQALEHLRRQPLPDAEANLNRLGLLKYGLACAAALAWLVPMMIWHRPLVAGLGVLVFYAIEAQMVFLFPLALDGSVRPFREARRWTRRAGGTLAVMRRVLPLAATMLFGGLLGRGFVRSWCIGCLAVCLWYEQLRSSPEAVPFRRRHRMMEFGAFYLPEVRHERIAWNLPRPVRLLYASDLHLGHAWTARVPDHLILLARQTSPDLILLGGDLIDHPRALESLRFLLRALSEIAPVHAIAGNHDLRAGLDVVRAVVQTAGAHWLPDCPIAHPVRIEGVLSPALPPLSDGPRI
ncbi:MAG TPA: metallophosphoesterase, partial [Gemmataceae bacterium]|nr:metallophosphoesterase [Gemmataceae bacterium]